MPQPKSISAGLRQAARQLLAICGAWVVLSAITSAEAQSALTYDRRVTPAVPWSVTWTDAPGGSRTFDGQVPAEVAGAFWEAKKSVVEMTSRCFTNRLMYSGTCISPPDYFGASAAQYICPATYIHNDFSTPNGPMCFGSGPTTSSNVVRSGVSKFCPVSSVLDRASEECFCPEGHLWVPERKRCFPVVTIDLSQAPKSCKANPPAGNPIYPLTGVKRQSETLDFGMGWLAFTLTYNNEQQQAVTDSSVVLANESQLESFGGAWHSNFHRFLLLGPTTTGYQEHTDRWGIRAFRGNGSVVSFEANRPYAGYRVAGGESRDSLVQTTEGFIYRDQASGVIERYDRTGRLLEMVRRTGESIRLAYHSPAPQSDVATSPFGNLSSITDSFGRSLRIEYQPVGGRYLISSVWHVVSGLESLALRAVYSNARLDAIIMADASSRSYLYAQPNGTAQLAGVLDESSSRVSTFTYDAFGRAKSTETALGTQKYSVTYTAPPQRMVSDVFDPSYSLIRRTIRWGAPVAAVITGPNGVNSAMSGDVFGGQAAVVSNSQPAGSGCAAATRSLEYNTDLTLARSSDFSGNFTCFGYGGVRRSETTRIEGLPFSAACANLLAPGAPLPEGSRKTSTAWHPDWELAVKVAVPRRVTSFIYNGQADPTNGNQLAACAPDTARLPDGKPLAVLCAQIEQASADADGRLGLSAPLLPGVSARVRRWTYNQFGQMLTEQDPLGHVSRYTYHATTNLAMAPAAAEGQVLGDLASVSRPAAVGGTIYFTKYNQMGRPVETIDLNGVTSRYDYDLRQRLTAVLVAGQATRREYWPTGLLKKVIQPDGSFIAYEYDAAQRLVAIRDEAGNQVSYTLDGMGNRTAETFVDAAGVLRRSLARSFDALGRVELTTGD